MAKGRKTGGRQKGAANVLTRQLKDMILESLDLAGGVTYLREQARKCPQAYLGLIGKVLPLQVGLGAPGESGVRRVIIELEEGGGTKD